EGSAGDFAGKALAKAQQGVLRAWTELPHCGNSANEFANYLKIESQRLLHALVVRSMDEIESDFLVALAKLLQHLHGGFQISPRPTLPHRQQPSGPFDKGPTNTNRLPSSRGRSNLRHPPIACCFPHQRPPNLTHATSK